MQPHRAGFGLIEKEGVDGFLDVAAEFRPGVSLREDIVREAFGHEAAVGLLRDGEHEFEAGTIASSAAGVNGRFPDGNLPCLP